MKNILFLFSILFLISCQKSKQEEKNEIQHQPKIEAKVLDSVNLASGKLVRISAFPSKKITPRPVDVWFPENYSSAKKYAVLYMHDGQMLFDATTTWNKQEWMIDEVASKLMEENKVRDFIVVGIHNIPEIRWQDLFPEKAMDYLKTADKEAIYKEALDTNFSTNLKGDAYLQFLVHELKPYIDKTYSVLTSKENTFVAGSSMGGLMSMYAVAEYPTIFGGAACISTHWVGAAPKEDNKLPAAIFDYLAANLPDAQTHKMYFDYGNKTLDAYYPKYAPKVDAIFMNGGYSAKNYKNLFFEGTDHSEKSWQARIDIPITFLLKK